MYDFPVMMVVPEIPLARLIAEMLTPYLLESPKRVSPFRTVCLMDLGFGAGLRFGFATGLGFGFATGLGFGFATGLGLGFGFATGLGFGVTLATVGRGAGVGVTLGFGVTLATGTGSGRGREIATGLGFGFGLGMEAVLRSLDPLFGGLSAHASI